MGFWQLLMVASLPIVQVLLVSALGALMATQYFNNLLSADIRKALNKIVFMVFTPALVFASLASTVTLGDMISWWFMPVNIGLTFLIGGTIGWIITKLIKPNLKVEGLLIAACASGNLGNLPIVIVPATCDEKGGPFGDRQTCHAAGISYASFSMALGGIFIWTYTYQVIKSRSLKYKALQAAEILKLPNKNLDANPETRLLSGGEENIAIEVSSDTESQVLVGQSSPKVLSKRTESFWHGVMGVFSQLLEELMEPPTIATVLGFIIGGVTWLKNLIIGDDAPLRVIQDTIQLLGEGSIPCVTLLLGGNLVQGLRSSTVKPSVIISVIVTRYILMPPVGILIVKGAAKFGLLPADPLFQYVLMIQYALPPAMAISTMTQLFDVAQEECSVILLYTYVFAAIAVTAWSTFFMWILS